MFDFKEMEERILGFWDEHNTFKESIKQRLGAKPFVFFEGPPTANGNPGIHHFIGRVFKDIFNRYKTMRGYYVLRKGGWDTHGLPVELQVEKALGFKNKKDIEAYGVAAYNAKCRESVWQYKTEWDRFTKRIGYWVDLEHPYITYETPYMESLWHIIGQFSKSKLLYQAHRVVPYCTRCGTPLSSHELGQPGAYKTVTDTSVYMKFRVKTSKVKLPKNTFILAWTTTPWTLPGNVALAVGKDIPYVLAKKPARPDDTGRSGGGDEHYVIAADLANKVLGAPLAIEKEFTGKQLVGTSYEPLFSIKALKKPKSYKVYDADFVSTTDGTGVVHTAVMYGEDDYQLGTKLGLPKVHTVDEAGKFVGVSAELDGKYVKASATEELILTYLDQSGFLLQKLPYEHEYPFCWRCGTPLLYYAKDSWFVRMSSLNKELLANNQTVNWVPAHLKDGRFGQWLKEGKDWSFSRERYWGTPLPVWRNKDNKQTLVISSLADLDTYRATKPNTYWVVRHGESDHNLTMTIDGGSADSHLTEKGIVQTEQTAKALKKTLGRKKPDLIVSSPLTRTRETAEIVARQLGVKKVIYDDRLQEIQLGPSLDGCHDSKYLETYPTYESRYNQQPPGGESLRDMKARLWDFMRELEKEHQGKQIILISHEYPIWMLAELASGWSMEQSIAEKEKRGVDFIDLAGVEQMTVRNFPRNDRGDVDMHRPYIDDVVLKKGTALLRRVPEVCDVWFDSGSMPFAQWHWPFENKALFAEQFPADFICEAVDQTRGWFYTLLAVSTAMGMGAPYKNVLSLELLLDEKGQKMSKSKGNVIKPDDVIGAVGVDTARWYFYTVNNPGDSKLFNMREVRERLTGFMGTLQNCVRFYELYRQESARMIQSDGQSGQVHKFSEATHLLDKWILSRLNGLIDHATRKLDEYDLTSAARAIEQFVVDDFSQWWLRRSRKRTDAMALLAHILRQLALILAPFIPFTAEDLWHNIRTEKDPISVHLADWPGAQLELIDPKLEETMMQVREYISAGLAIRKNESIKVRQPLASAMLPAKPLPADLEELILQELNVKAVAYGSEVVQLDTHIGTELRAEGFAREVMRMIQDMRKEIGLSVGDRVYCQWHSQDKEVVDAILAHSEIIARETGLSALVFKPDDPSDRSGRAGKTLTIEKNTDLASGKPLWIGLKK